MPQTLIRVCGKKFLTVIPLLLSFDLILTEKEIKSKKEPLPKSETGSQRGSPVITSTVSPACIVVLPWGIMAKALVPAKLIKLAELCCPEAS